MVYGSMHAHVTAHITTVHIYGITGYVSTDPHAIRDLDHVLQHLHRDGDAQEGNPTSQVTWDHGYWYPLQHAARHQQGTCMV